jgi:hypothetical protein
VRRFVPEPPEVQVQVQVRRFVPEPPEVQVQVQVRRFCTSGRCNARPMPGGFQLIINVSKKDSCW